MVQCGSGLSEKRPPQAHVFQCLVHSWWYCLKVREPSTGAAFLEEGAAARMCSPLFRWFCQLPAPGSSSPTSSAIISAPRKKRKQTSFLQVFVVTAFCHYNWKAMNTDAIFVTIFVFYTSFSVNICGDRGSVHRSPTVKHRTDHRGPGCHVQRSSAKFEFPPRLIWSGFHGSPRPFPMSGSSLIFSHVASPQRNSSMHNPTLGLERDQHWEEEHRRGPGRSLL